MDITGQVEPNVGRRLHEAGLMLAWFEPPAVDIEDGEECPGYGITTTLPMGWDVVVEGRRRVCDPCVKKHAPELYLARELANDVRLGLGTDGKTPLREVVALAMLDLARVADALAREYHATPLPF